MAVPKTPAPTVLSVNLAPMVDVMMVLIIFFMLATDLVRSETQEVALPYAPAAKQIAGPGELGNRVVINVLARPFESADVVDYYIADKPVTPPMILERLRREAQLDPNVRCVIRADRDVAFRHVQTVLIACAQAKVANLAFSAIKSEEPEEAAP
jgi:biopolymer transport protein ExbD